MLTAREIAVSCDGRYDCVADVAKALTAAFEGSTLSIVTANVLQCNGFCGYITCPVFDRKTHFIGYIAGSCCEGVYTFKYYN